MSIFSKVQVRKPKTNTFDLSHDRKFSMNMGTITPILVMDTVPGDTISVQTSQLLRFAPMLAPIMHQVSVYTHFFFVPNRILWTNWERFITGGEDGNDTSVFPTINLRTFGTAIGSLQDYMGCPIEAAGTGTTNVSAMPFAAYQAIWNEYYRDQNLQVPIDYQLIDGDNSNVTPLTTIRSRAWQHDYFTSALPWTQKGPEATIPIGDTAPINFVPGNAAIGRDTLGAPDGVGPIEVSATGSQLRNQTTTNFLTIDNASSLEADLSSATATTINDLRQAFRLQEWLEKNARGGSRYTESIMSHFGVKSSDARLQRPEFLGGGSTPVTISEVLQTSAAATEPTPQGNMAGHGISVGGNNRFKYFCEEHGYIIGLQTVMPKSAYQQGLPKHFRKLDKFDYYWPSFAHLGEQPIMNWELFYDRTDGLNNTTFGYTPRYAEYKYMNSSVHGEYRESLDFWHMGRKFSTRPLLNDEFIQMQPLETSRIFAVTGQAEQLYCHTYHKIKARRPMPFFGTPNI